MNIDSSLLTQVQNAKNDLDNLNRSLDNKKFLLSEKKKELDALLEELYKTYDCSSLEELTNKLVSLTQEVNNGLIQLNALIGGN